MYIQFHTHTTIPSGMIINEDLTGQTEPDGQTDRRMKTQKYIIYRWCPPNKNIESRDDFKNETWNKNVDYC